MQAFKILIAPVGRENFPHTSGPNKIGNWTFRPDMKIFLCPSEWCFQHPTTSSAFLQTFFSVVSVDPACSCFPNNSALTIGSPFPLHVYPYLLFFSITICARFRFVSGYPASCSHNHITVVNYEHRK